MRLAALGLLVALFLPLGSARAGTTGGGTPSFALDVSSNASGDSLSFAPALTTNPDGSLKALGSDAAPSFSIAFDIDLNPDPGLSGSFTLTNLSGLNQSFTLVATLSGVSVPGQTTLSGFYGPLTYTDLNDMNVTLASALFYQARIDGQGVQNLGSFSLNAQGDGGSGPVSGTDDGLSFGPDSGGPPIATSIAVAFPAFSLTARDRVEVHFGFSAVPEPQLGSLFALLAVIFLPIAMKKFAA